MLNYFKEFPSEELAKMIKHIDRFDEYNPIDAKVAAEQAIEEAEKVSEEIIESNL